MPWAIIGLWCMIWNVYLNVDFNRDWAGGNVFLLGNTTIGWIEYFLSVLLVFEVDPWLRHAKFIRFWSLMWAVGFNSLYFLAALKFFYMVNGYINTPYGEADWFDVYLCMVIFYNLILHIG